MTYAFTQDLPFSKDVYERFRTAMSEERPKGLIVHVAIAIENGVRWLEVWDSEEDYNEFIEVRVRPLIDGVFRGTEWRPPEVEPEPRPIEVLDVWKRAPEDEQV